MNRMMVVATGALLAALVVETVRGSRARGSGLLSALRLDSAEAAHDTTREMEIGNLKDSVRVFVRRAEQQEQTADGLDRALQARRMAQVKARVGVAPLDTVVRADTVYVSADSVRRSRFNVRQAPYTVVGELAMRPGRGDSVALHIEVDTIPLQVRVSCGPPGNGGANRAMVVALAPKWAHVALSAVEQAPSVCNPAFVAGGFTSRISNILRRAGISAGVAAVSEPNGQIAVRPAVMIGIRVWP
jgi:hypothetical protein